MRVVAAGRSHPGKLRERNEDCFCLGASFGRAELQSVGEVPFLAAVADGMGGHHGGDRASEAILSALCRSFSESPPATVEEFQLLLERADAEMTSALQDVTDAGTTLAGVALLQPNLLVVFHVGDSRVLRFSGGYLRALTVDHTPVGQDLASGRMDEEAAARSGVAGLLTRSAGVRQKLEPEIQTLSFAPGDCFLICTDGLHGAGRGLSQDDLKACFSVERRLEETVHIGVEAAVAHDGSDNATLVAVRVE